MIDTGIDYTHPDLAPTSGRRRRRSPSPSAALTIKCAAGTHGFNAITGACDPMDDHDHGTHVAGTIGAAGNNGVGVAGVNWTTSLMGAKFLDPDGTGTIADAIDAIEFPIQAKQVLGARRQHPRAVEQLGRSEFSQALHDEIARGRRDDMLFVAAAGNNGLQRLFRRIRRATRAERHRRRGDGRTRHARLLQLRRPSVHLGAPGVDIFSTVRQNLSLHERHVDGDAARVRARRRWCCRGAASTRATSRTVLLDASIRSRASRA